MIKSFCVVDFYLFFVPCSCTSGHSCVGGSGVCVRQGSCSYLSPPTVLLWLSHFRRKKACRVAPHWKYCHTNADVIWHRHKDVVKLLRKTGAHFSRDELEEAGSELCRSLSHTQTQFQIHNNPSYIVNTSPTSLLTLNLYQRNAPWLHSIGTPPYLVPPLLSEMLTY